MLRWAMNNLIDLKYSCGDMKVVEVVMYRSKWFVCSAASVLTFFRESYSELLKASEQLV